MTLLNDLVVVATVVVATTIPGLLASGFARLLEHV